MRLPRRVNSPPAAPPTNRMCRNRLPSEKALGASELKNLFEQASVAVTSMQRGEPTLEDVFLNLAKG